MRAPAMQGTPLSAAYRRILSEWWFLNDEGSRGKPITARALFHVRLQESLNPKRHRVLAHCLSFGAARRRSLGMLRGLLGLEAACCTSLSGIAAGFFILRFAAA